MTLRKRLGVVPVIAVLAFAAPVASASAQSTPAPGPSSIPCYPYPAFCGPDGNRWFSFWNPVRIGPIQLPPLFGPIQIPAT